MSQQNKSKVFMTLIQQQLFFNEQKCIHHLFFSVVLTQLCVPSASDSLPCAIREGTYFCFQRRLTEIPEGFPADAEAIYLNYNRISIVRQNAFFPSGHANSSSLKRLILHDNEVQVCFLPLKNLSHTNLNS